MALQYEQYDECQEDFSLFQMKEYSRSSACQSRKCARHFIFHDTCFLINIPHPFYLNCFIAARWMRSKLFLGNKILLQSNFFFGLPSMHGNSLASVSYNAFFFFTWLLCTLPLSLRMSIMVKKMAVLQCVINQWRQTGYISVPQSIRIPTPLMQCEECTHPSPWSYMRFKHFNFLMEARQTVVHFGIL